MTKKTDSLPSVLAFERKIAPSDGIMFGTDWEKRSMVSDRDVLKLVEKSVRGTNSSRLFKKAESANLQRIDACALNEQDDTLVLKFTVKFFGGLKKPSSCNNQSFLETYQSALNAFNDGIGFAELAKRYALNLANARFLWRNRVGASQIEVKVKAKSASFELPECEWTFDALGFDLRNFSSDNKEISSLAALIAQALSSDDGFLLLEVSAAAQIGFGQEVYPSQELVLDSGKPRAAEAVAQRDPSQELVLDSGKTDRFAKSRILYQVNQSAAMHSQKIGNAIRTVDTWYPEAENFGNAPIAAEPYGSVTSLRHAFRTPATKQDFYSLFDAWAMGGSLNEDEANYVVAVLIRGGVFGKGDKA